MPIFARFDSLDRGVIDQQGNRHVPPGTPSVVRATKCVVETFHQTNELISQRGIDILPGITNYFGVGLDMKEAESAANCDINVATVR